MKIMLTKIKAGHYKYDIYELIKWQPESQNRYLWCLAIDRVGMDDFTTLAQAKAHIAKDLELRGKAK